MKFRLSYIFTVLAALAFTTHLEAQTKKTVTINGTNLNHIGSDKYFTYTDSEFGTIRFGNGTTSISYSSDGPKYLSIGKKTTHNLTFSGGLISNNDYVVLISKVLVRATAYNSNAFGTRNITLKSTDGNTSNTVNVNNANVNPQNNDSRYKNVEISGSDLGNNYTVTLGDGSNAGFQIDKIEITYEAKPKFYFSATATPNNENYGSSSASVTEYVLGNGGQTSASATATFTANPNSGYALAGWGTSANATTYESTANPYQTSITNSTPCSKVDKTLYAIFKHLPMFYFAANSPGVTGGTATANVESASVMGGKLAQTSASTTATFSATPQSGYEFQGWGTSQSASTYESTDNPYTATLTNNKAESEVTKTLYAIFKPVFNFSASATSSNDALGTATASVNDTKILGDVGATEMSTTATFTATPANDCVFKGWYEASDYSGEPVSTNATYNVTLTNTTIGSTASKVLYALFKKKQNLQWADADLDLNLVNGQNYSSAASVTSGKKITYTTDNAQAVTIDNDGTIHAVGLGDAHITASVEGNDIYQSETITRDFSVGEIKQATFTPAWGEGTSTDIKVDGRTSIALTNIANDASFTVSATPEGIIGWTRNGNTLEISAVKAGTATLTLSQQGSAVLAGNQVAYTITVSKYPNSFALSSQTKAMKVGEVWENVVTSEGNGNTQVSYSSEGIATYDAAANKITADAEGSTAITFTQEATARNEGTSKTVNITVTRIANSLSITLGSTEVNVGDQINLMVSGNDSKAAIIGHISDVTLSSDVNNGDDVITYADGVITARNAGTAKIKFTQEATAKYTAYESDTYTITVNKISNAITVTLDEEQKNSKNVGRGATVALAYSSPSDGAYNINLTSGSNDIATISGYTITAGNTDGTNIWEITQAETYKYSAATATIRVKVNSVAEEEGYVFVGYTGKEETSVEFELSGPGKDIYLGARKSGVGNTTIQVRASTSDSWVTVKEFDTKYSLSGCESYSFFDIIPEDARYVRIYGSGSIHHFTDVKVTRRTYVHATATQTNLGEVYTDKTASASFNVSYSSTNGGNIEIISNNPRFKVDTENIEVRKAAFGLLPDPLADTQSITVDNNSDNVSDPVVVTVTYTPDPGHLGNDEGTFTISDRYYSAELTFTAFAKKYETSIGRGSNTATKTDVDGTIDNAFAFTGTSAATPSADSNDDFYYTITSTYTSDVHTDEGVITYDPATNTITGLNAGTAKLTIYQKSTDNYAALSQTFEFSVNKLENPVSIALSTVSLEVDGEAAVQLTNDDGKGALSVAYSNIAYTSESMNREGGFLSYNAENETLTAINAGTATVTVTQAETYKYLSKSRQFTVTVDKLAQTLSWDREVETSLQIGAVIEGNTATSAQELSPVAYTSSNTVAIEVDGNTGKLTAKAVGSNITITASQAGNYKYAPATITRQFSVFNKQAPAFIPDEACYDSSTKTITVKWEGSTTISVTGVGSEEEAGFTITNGNDAVISVVRNESTITITGLSIGNTTLTLTQAANDDFLGKSETYTINVVMPSDYLTLDPSADFELAEDGEYSKIFLKRAIPAGLNTIALPFNTTAKALGAQKAYSFVNVGVKEGAYYFYFKELAADETLLAGVPYVILCENTISERVISDTDGISVSSTEELQRVGTVNCGQWSFVANFSAGVDGNGIDMNGKYGVVNSADPKRNEIMLGGEGSKLQAYTAYFILNQSSPSSYTSSAPASTKATGSAVAPSAAGSSAAADLPANAIPLFTVKEYVSFSIFCTINSRVSLLSAS